MSWGCKSAAADGHMSGQPCCASACMCTELTRLHGTARARRHIQVEAHHTSRVHAWIHKSRPHQPLGCWQVELAAAGLLVGSRRARALRPPRPGGCMPPAQGSAAAGGGGAAAQDMAGAPAQGRAPWQSRRGRPAFVLVPKRGRPLLPLPLPPASLLADADGWARLKAGWSAVPC